ncbi:MAG: ATP-binding protein, partial [Chloroflexi bacterium]|nr:ATP-binding protein [Chloroflexota bacterium]
HIEDDIPLIQADAARLSQVLNNLLSNALRHTPSEGMIELSIQASPESVRLTVRDNGDGIPQEQLTHIFDRFYRADRSRTRSTGGSGLGLAIVKGLVEAHGGTVSAYSKGLGQGTTFVVRLPT